MKVNSLKRDAPDFPEVLRQITVPPKELFWLGAHPNSLIKAPRVAIVGSRRMSTYGRVVTQPLTTQLATQGGMIIISGLALGVDAAAHRAALEVGGLTVAVLPTSLDNIYPASHQNLAKQIIDSGGCLISEYSTDTPVYKTNFTARNRIVSGLSDV